MDIYLAKPRGFCAGVDLAVDIVNLALKKFTRKYKKSKYYKDVIINIVDEVPENSIVVFSAHGSPPSDYLRAKELNLTVLDAICPLVTKVHNEAKKYSKEGKKIILIGHKGHQEVIGTSGQTEMDIIDDKNPNIPKYK